MDKTTFIHAKLIPLQKALAEGGKRCPLFLIISSIK